MRKAITLLAAVLIASSALAYASPSFKYPRHADPSTFGLGLDPFTYASLLSQVGSYVLFEDYESAAKVLKILVSSKAIPPGLRPIYDMYNSLHDLMVKYVQNATSERDLALSEYLRANFTGAKYHAERALYYLAKANITLSRLETLNREVSRRFGVPIAYLEKVCSVYREKISREYEIVRGLLENIEKSVVVKLLPTKLRISVDRDAVYVGDELHVYGRLTDNASRPIPGRAVVVTVYLGTKKLSRYAVTDDEGFFNATFTIPYDYTASEAVVQAFYSPAGEDAMVYGASASNKVRVKVLFYKVSVQVIPHPTQATPGSTIELEILASCNDPSVKEVDALLYVFGTNMTVKLACGARTVVEIKVPYGIREGYYDVIVAGGGYWRYAPFRASAEIYVYRLPTRIEEVTVPQYLAVGFAQQVSVRVWAPANVGGVLHIYVGEREVFRENITANSRVTALIAPPVTMFTGYKKLTVVVDFDEPYRDVKFETTVLVLNIFDIVVIVLALSMICIRIASFIMREEEMTSFMAEYMRLKHTPPKLPKVKTSEAELPPVREYVSIVKLLEDRYGLRIYSWETLREFSDRVCRTVSDICSGFKKLTLLTEAVVYGRKRVGDELRKISQELVRWLSRGKG